VRRLALRQHQRVGACGPGKGILLADCYKLHEIIISGLTFGRQVAKSIWTLALNFNFLISARDQSNQKAENASRVWAQAKLDMMRKG